MNGETNGNHATNRRPLLTVEAALWMAIAIGGLALRLARLDYASLSVSEARMAMLSWRAVLGEGMPLEGYSPFLFERQDDS